MQKSHMKERASVKHCLNKKGSAGFTLVEIMVVLIILGILMTFVGSKIWGAGDKAKARLTQGVLSSLKMSIEQFRLENNALPRSLNDLISCNKEGGGACVPILGKQDELKDSWGNLVVYSATGDGKYRIKSLGADGKDGGDGVNFDQFLDGP